MAIWIHCVLCSTGEGGRQYGYIACSVPQVREGGNMDTLHAVPQVREGGNMDTSCALFLR